MLIKYIRFKNKKKADRGGLKVSPQLPSLFNGMTGDCKPSSGIQYSLGG